MKIKKPPTFMPKIDIVKREYSRKDYKDKHLYIEGMYFIDSGNTLRIWVTEKKNESTRISNNNKLTQ